MGRLSLNPHPEHRRVRHPSKFSKASREIEERFLHCARQQLRRSEVEKKKRRLASVGMTGLRVDLTEKHFWAPFPAQARLIAYAPFGCLITFAGVDHVFLFLSFLVEHGEWAAVGGHQVHF